MIDSRAIGNFISYKALSRLGLLIRTKEKGYTLRLIDGIEIGYRKVIHEIILIIIILGEYYERISFDITDIGSDDIILGIL